MPTTPRRSLLSFGIAAIAATSLLVAAAPASAAQDPRLIVGFADGESVAGQIAALRQSGVDGLTSAELRNDDVPALEAASVEVDAGELGAVRAALLRRDDVEFVEVDRMAHAFWSPNDLQLHEQWALPKLGAFTAWDTARGTGVKIAVVDTGVDYIHPELQGKVELGWDYVANDADPMDEQGHGTHVAGIAAGIADDATGVAGLAPNARILAMRALDQDGSGYYSWIANAITGSADRGAKVINLSLGGTEGSELLEQAVNYASAKGSIVTCASGNESATAVGFPARYEACLSVGATDSNDERASFSNQGPGLDVTAPGVGILSSIRGGGYDSWDGTSMATPYASGLAALLFSQRLSRAQVWDVMNTTAHDLGAPGYDTAYGNGRIDAAAAVAKAATLPVPAADAEKPSVSALGVGKPHRTGAVVFTRVWKKAKASRWRSVGVTDYRGRYTWKKTSTKGQRRVVTEFKMKSRRVYSRTVTYRKVRVPKSSSAAWSVQVAVTAADNVGVDRVGLQVDGKWTGVDWNGTDGWSVTFTCHPGAHTLVAHAFDASDNDGTVEQRHTFVC